MFGKLRLDLGIFAPKNMYHQSTSMPSATSDARKSVCTFCGKSQAIRFKERAPPRIALEISLQYKAGAATKKLFLYVSDLP